MRNRKMSYYVTMMAIILLLTFLIPVMIRTASNAFISRFAPDVAEAETEADDRGYRVMEGFTENTEDVLSDSLATSDEYAGEPEHDPDLMKKELQQRKEQTDDDLASYLKKQDPVLSESRAGMLEAFVNGREDALTKAVADHLYGTYGALFDISAIDVVDFIDDSQTELTCQLKVTAMIGKKEYSEYYFATYNKVYDFYSIYAYHE